MRDKITLGIIGLGGMGQATAKSIQDGKLPGINVTALADINQEKIALAGKTLGVARCFTDYKVLLQQDDIQAVYIATPNAFHCEQAIAALESGKHVLLEKPPAINPEQTAAILKHTGRGQQVFMVNFPMRCSKSAVWLKKMISAGELGEIYYAKAAYLRRNLIPGKGGWFTNRELSGGGVIMDLGVHIIDRMCWLMEATRPVAVAGATYRHLISEGHSGDWPPPLTRAGEQFNNKIDVEDLGVASVRFANGMSLSIEASWAGFSNEGMVFDLMGTKAGAHEDSSGLRLFGPGSATKDPAATAAMLASLETARPWSQFVEAVQKRSCPPINANLLMVVSRIIEAIYKSAESGREVRLD